MKLEGYIIAFKDHPDDVKLKMGFQTFARTPYESWNRHIGIERSVSNDRSILIQRWFDRGWRLYKATLSLDKMDVKNE